MTLGDKQRLFTRLLATLLQKMWSEGYEVTLAAGYVDPGSTGPHLPTGEHPKRLAQDLNLFKDGQYLTTTEAYQPFGVYWESLHPLCRWGGRWSDGNHFSLFDGGMA